jgi:hypothetical protein
MRFIEGRCLLQAQAQIAVSALGWDGWFATSEGFSSFHEGLGDVTVFSAGDRLEQFAERGEFSELSCGGGKNAGEFVPHSRGDCGDTQAVGVEEARVEADRHAAPPLPVHHREQDMGEVGPGQVPMAGHPLDAVRRIDAEDEGKGGASRASGPPPAP